MSETRASLCPFDHEHCEAEDCPCWCHPPGRMTPEEWEAAKADVIGRAQADAKRRGLGDHYNDPEGITRLAHIFRRARARRDGTEDR